MSWRKDLSGYFTFSRKDRIGILALISLVLIIILIPELFSRPPGPTQLVADSAFLKAIRTETQDKTPQQGVAPGPYRNKEFPFVASPESEYNEKATLFPFDPNTLDLRGWKRLGLPDKTVRTINNYRLKGGKFFKREDLKKIWGLPPGFYERAETFIEIPTTSPSSFAKTGYVERSQRNEAHISIDINKADTSAFISLPGIGSILANRIIAFRTKLGGFYSVDQIGETYGLPDSTYRKIKTHLQVVENSWQMFNLNTATKEELRTHPYIRWNLANAIVEYRNQHGNFNTIEDLKKIALIDETTFKKITPYLSL